MKSKMLSIESQLNNFQIGSAQNIQKEQDALKAKVNEELDSSNLQSMLQKKIQMYRGFNKGGGSNTENSSKLQLNQPKYTMPKTEQVSPTVAAKDKP